MDTSEGIEGVGIHQKGLEDWKQRGDTSEGIGGVGIHQKGLEWKQRGDTSEGIGGVGIRQKGLEQASKFVKIHGSKLLLLSLKAGSKTIFLVGIF